MKTDRIRSLGQTILMMASVLTPLSLPAFQGGSGAWLAVEHSSFRDHLASLSAEERTEQLRDWALIAASMDAEPGNNTPGDTLFTVQALRIDPLQSLTRRRVGPTRWLSLANDRVLAMIPDGSADPLLLLGRIADEYRVESSGPPREVLIYTYRADEKTSDLAIKKDRAIPGASLYDAAAGFYEEDVRTMADLQKFLARNLDLVLFHDAGDHVRLGGRVHASQAQLIRVEDLAVIVRAGRGLGDQVRAELERRGLRETYEARVNDIVSKFLQEQPSMLKSYSDFETLRQAVYLKAPYEEFLKHQVDGVLQENPPGLGFSLDPRTNFPQIAKDLRSAAAGSDDFLTKWLLPVEMDDIKRQNKTYIQGFDELFLKKVATLNPVVADRETSLAGLMGIVRAEAGAPAVKPADPKRTAESALERLIASTPGEVEEEANDLVDGIRRASKAKSAELVRIADALAKSDITPLLDFKRYLQAEIAGITIRAGAPKYRILDLQQMLKSNGMDVAVDGVYGPKTGALIRTFQERKDLKPTGVVDVETWKVLLESDPEKAKELDYLHELLQQLEEHRDYQCARYDGLFAGTEVGMTLYYTDLVMKLWGFANGSQKPLVPGFIPEAEYQLAEIYKDDILHHPSTRGWLGGLLDAMGFYDAGVTVHFAPVATRLYNASSSYLFPGAEVPANFMAERFSSWWNNHYSEVADFEPQYHRLNQLMKWAAILQSKTGALPAPLADLAALNVAPAGRFDQWWSRHKELKVPENVSFLAVPGEGTECLAIVTSEPFRAFGGLYSLSGGVTLPKTEEIAAKLENDVKRTLVTDPRQRIPGANFAGFEAKDGEIHIPIRSKEVSKSGKNGPAPFNGEEIRSRTGDWSDVLPKEQRVNGKASAVATGTLASSFETKPDALTITASLGGMHLDRVEFSRSAEGYRVAGEEAAHIAAARHLTSPVEGEKWTELSLPDGDVLMESAASDAWARVRAAKGDIGEGVRVDAGGLKDILPATAAELEKSTSELAWVALGRRGFLGSEGGARLVKGPPDGAAPLTLTAKGKAVQAMLDNSGVYVKRGAGAFAQSLADFRTVTEAFDGEDLAAVMTAGRRKGAVQFARRSGKGDVVLAGFGGGGNEGTPPISTTFFDDMIPPKGKFIRGILVVDDPNTPLKVADGLIELPPDASDEVRQQARRISQVAEAKPEVGARIEKLPAVMPDDLRFLEGHREGRGANYIEFRAVPSQKMGATVLADLQFTAEDPEIIVRQGDRIYTIPLANAGEAITAQKRVDQVMQGNAGAITVAELKTESRPFFEVLETVRQKTGGRRFLTKEAGEVNAETIYRLGGGDEGVRFPRDISDVTLSLQHADRKVTPSVAESVVASTVALNDPKFPVAAKAAALLDSLLARVESPVSYDDFGTILDDSEKQITLIARYREGGLVFQDRWVSLKEIAEDMKLISQKDLLHLITNGGQDVVDAFANSGRFQRVILTRFTSGDQPSFDQAMSQLTDYFGTFAIPVAVFGPDDWKELKADAGDAGLLLSALSKAVGDTTEIDVSSLMARGRGRGLDWGSPEGVSILDRIRRKLQAKPGVDADSAFDSLNAHILSGVPEASARSATAALQGVSQGKNE